MVRKKKAPTAEGTAPTTVAEWASNVETEVRRENEPTADTKEHRAFMNRLVHESFLAAAEVDFLGAMGAVMTGARMAVPGMDIGEPERITAQELQAIIDRRQG